MHAGQGIVLGGGNEYSAQPVVPIPSAIFLLAPGLMGLAALRRKFQK